MSIFWGLITARGGSKGIPRKNLAPLCDKPLIGWTIEAAQASCLLNYAFVSTDCPKIAETSRSFKIDVPFLRPAELAQDNSAHIPVILHAIETVSKIRRETPDYVVLLQPTSPFRTAEDIDNAIELIQQKSAPSLASVSYAPHPHFIKTLTNEGFLRDIMPSTSSYTPRQKLEPTYEINGAIYINNYRELQSSRTQTSERTIGYVMPPERSVDINSPWDLELAEYILNSALVTN